MGKVACGAALWYNKKVKLLCSRDVSASLERVTSQLLRSLATVNSIPLRASKESLSTGLSGSTLIPLLSGEEITLQEMATSKWGRWLYSCDADGNIVPGYAHATRLTTGISRSIRVILDSGESFVCSLGHKVMMRDGTYRDASKLYPYDSLMPLYRRLSTEKKIPGYEQVLNPATGKWLFTHRIVAEYLIENLLEVIHHVDFNKLNNDPANLRPMTWKDHTELHQQQVQLLEEYAKSEQGRQKSRENMQALWNDPIWREQSVQRIRENGHKVAMQLIAEGRCGTQAQDKDVLRERGRQHGLVHYHQLHTPEAKQRAIESQRKLFEEDAAYREMRQENARQNIASYNASLADGTRTITEKQRAARQENGRRNFGDTEKRRIAQLKTTWKRFHQDTYPTFEEYLATRQNNHKVIRIEDAGTSDVYGLIVDGRFNFALSSGVFVQIQITAS